MKRIAVPCEGGQVCAHFGHAPQFILYEVEPARRQVLREQTVNAPPHQPGMRPAWLAQQGAQVILAGGMGARAQELFAAQGIEVIVGVTDGPPRQAVDAYLQGTLRSTGEVCERHEGPCH